MHVAVLIHNTSHSLGCQLREMLQARLNCLTPSLVSFEQAEEALARGQVSMLVVVLSPFADRALNLLRKIRSQVAGPVLAVGLASDSKLILRALHEGADHYLDEADLEAQLEAVLQRLQIKEDAVRQPAGRVMAMLGASGGTGASTLAVNLAGVLAREAGRCALIDLKPGVGDLAALLDLKPTHNLADLCLNAARMDRAMFESAMVLHPSGVHLLAPPQMYEDIRLVTAQGVNKTVQPGPRCVPLHRDRSGRLLPRGTGGGVAAVGFHSAGVSSRFHVASQHQTHSRLFGASGHRTGERVRLVINRYGQAKELPLSQAEEALGRKIAFIVPDDPKTINAANNAGEPAVFRTPSAKVSQSIVQLANGLIKPDSGKSSTVRQAVKSVNGWLAVFHG